MLQNQSSGIRLTLDKNIKIFPEIEILPKKENEHPRVGRSERHTLDPAN